jgi:hypothetical protein
LTLELHTGHGRHGEVTFLSDASPGSPHDAFLRECVGAERVEATTDNPEATTGMTYGQIANGFRAVVPHARCFSSSVEFGIVNEDNQIVATCREQWVYRRGARDPSANAAVVWTYRCWFTPDRRDWEDATVQRGQAHFERALAAVNEWND